MMDAARITSLLSDYSKKTCTVRETGFSMTRPCGKYVHLTLNYTVTLILTLTITLISCSSITFPSSSSYRQNYFNEHTNVAPNPHTDSDPIPVEFDSCKK